MTAIDMDLDAFVVECTSFRLALTERFRGDAAAWLNLAPDHLNWHRSMDTYGDAKNKIFANQRPDDVAIGFARDAEVMRRLAAAPARHVTFGAADSDYRVAADALVGPSGELAPVAALRRRLPHDLTNGLAAAALVLESRARRPRRPSPPGSPAFTGPPHRIELVGEADGVAWYNDSKATTPHAASVAIAGFDRVVLIAGGRNKGLDLSPMAAVDAGAPTACARSWRSARPPMSSPPRSAVATLRFSGRRRCPTLSTSPGQLPAPATSSYCPRAAPASTGTPTAATRPAAITSASSSGRA